MAFVMCPKHGGHGAAAVCRHLLNAVIAGERLPQAAGLSVDYEGTRLGPIWFCRTCANQYGIPREGMLLTGDAGLDRMYEWGWCPVCPVCWRDAGGTG
jgi:hypothetical protein